ncbi:ankyrin repeat domain-containing protein (plasmid) [Paraburkholderia sp. FT54]|uniref:ankyrin repeat domain-containing protein n=1 Tax=Paraburkholderia sp. FT54 TaxID=3074437 RepID=UPI002877CD12|nr:ankyrin repeat domain-containing protein [Paraburkholderia sp. FT54]WNC95166.1 ankyrin repeat domain-containing protein [Paraburkholderia sp. FT54]
MKNLVWALAGVVAALVSVAFSGCASLSERLSAPTAGVDVSKYGKEWFDAARAGRWDITQALLEAHFPIDATTPQGYTALILAAYDEQPDMLHRLIEAGANPCLGDRNGNTALMGALYKGGTDIVRTLMDTSCDINQTNNAGETALAFAALFGRFDLLPELVKKGADPNHTDARGNTAMEAVMAQGNQAAVRALRQVGATR